MKTPLGTEVDFGHTVSHTLYCIPALGERGTAPPLFGPCLLWPRSPISATAELLFLYLYRTVVVTWCNSKRFQRIESRLL